MADPKWLAEARKHLGQKEIVGTKHNPVILKWWTAIRAPFTDDETPWCAAFVGAMLEAVGIKSTRSAWARSYLKWGRTLAKPQVGCIVVFQRGKSNGHVAFYLGTDAKGNIRILGGNQGNAVTIAAYPAARVLGYRWPSDSSAPLPLPPAKPKPADIEEEAEDAPDEELSKNPLKKFWGWVTGGGIATFAGALTDWQVALVIVGALLLAAAGYAVWWYFNRRGA